MKLLISLIQVLLISIFTTVAYTQSDLHLIDIGNFKTIEGANIEACKIGYRTLGSINQDSSNVIVWPTWFDGTSKSLVKPYNIPKWIDTSGFYIIVIDAFGNGVSSSPSNTKDFPSISIRDMVNSQYKLLTEHLNFNHVYAVVGASMGGMQVFEWIVSYPDFMDKAVPIIGSPKLGSYDLLVYRTQVDLIQRAKTHDEDMDIAMKRVYDVLYMNLYTPENINNHVEPEKMENWRTGKYKYMMDPMNYALQMSAMIGQDIYKSMSIAPEEIADIVHAEVLVIVATQDHLVTPHSSVAFAENIGCQLIELTGDCGHCSIWCESEKIFEATKSFFGP